MKPKHLVLSVLVLSMFALNAYSKTRGPVGTEVIIELDQKNYKQVDMDVLIKTDKNSYKQDETVHFTIHNRSTEVISYYGHLGYESTIMQKEANKSGTWESLDIVYPYDGIHFLAHLQPNETASFQWDQTVLDIENYPNRIPPSSGNYRIKFVYWTNCPYLWPVAGCITPCPLPVPSQDCPEHIIFSNEFQIEGTPLTRR